MHYLLLMRWGQRLTISYWALIRMAFSSRQPIASNGLQMPGILFCYGTTTETYRLHEGVCAEARVVSVIRAGIFIDLFGVECYIPLRELSYQRYLDASTHFEPGQRVLVHITSLDRSDRDHIQVTASIKQTQQDPYEQAMRKYMVGKPVCWCGERRRYQRRLRGFRRYRLPLSIPPNEAVRPKGPALPSEFSVSTKNLTESGV